MPCEATISRIALGVEGGLDYLGPRSYALPLSMNESHGPPGSRIRRPTWDPTLGRSSSLGV